MTDPAATSTLVEIGARYALPAESVRRLSILVELLSDIRTAPTAIHDRQHILRDHIADALVALELPEVASADLIVDIGAGAGVPGLPLAIAQPLASVTLLESNARRCAFIDSAIRACSVGNATAVAARAEAWPAGIGRFDLVTARAVAALDVVAEYAAPLLRLGGSLVAWRGRRDLSAEDDAARAASILGLAVAAPARAHPFPGAEHRYLHVMRKVAQTPDGFPRRVGVASKRPLGSRLTGAI
jgi:16S rRNA (guanine527-N7)-methyltransferase